MSKDKSQNFTEISFVLPELELFLAFNESFHEMQKVFGLILFTKAESCQNFIYHFTLKIQQEQTSLAICQSHCCCCLPRPSKIIESKFFLIFSVYISGAERGFPTKVCTLSYHTQKHKFGALRPWASKLNASKHRDSHSVGHVESAIFHCNVVMQQDHVEHCGSLHPYFHQEHVLHM